jgi:hypothetical protein
MEIDEKALEAACKAFWGERWREDGGWFPGNTRDEYMGKMRATILAYESSCSQSSDARDEWIDVPEEELSPELLEVIAETRGKIAIAMMGVYPTRKFKVALKRPADRKGGQ